MATVRAQEASSSTSRYTYDVFLSFRGEDTRKTFTDHLYTALVQAGFRTFRDNDEIERGESIRPELQKAIQQSRVSIIVLSKNYAFSTWCLDELVMILECKIAFGRVVLPVFYDVDPPELRKQKGRTAEAFVSYVEKFELEKVKAWRRALKEVADLAGMELKNQADGHQSKFIQKILKVIEDKLSRTPLHVAPYLVGMHSRAERINMWVQDGSTDVSVLGICGMGGIGKTTIAKFVYNHNSTSFAGSSFLANINEVSKQPNGLVSLQKQLISDISNRKQKKIHNVDEGIIKIKNAVCCKRVLLVFDDVDQHDQLYAVRGTQDWLFPGSKIIITTRNEGLLRPHEVYNVQELDHGESIKLFSLHAFGEDCPTESYIEHTERAVRVCEGLPLALQVLGSSLSGKDTDRWVNELEKLEAIPHSKIVEKLKISYDSLQDDYDKRLFLHIACFFVGKGKDYTVQILDKCDLHSKVGIQNLIDRCLLTIDSSNKLMMHRLLQEMGREIVRQESLVPGERSRLWHNEDAFSVLKNETGTKTIEGLTLDMCIWKENVNNAKKRRYEEFCDKSLLSKQRISLKRRCLRFFLGKPVSIVLRSPNNIDLTLRTDAFEKMKMLCLLQLYYVKLTGCYKNFPKSLRLLCWHGFPLKSVPTDISLENLVALDMRYSKLEQVWKGYKFLGSLKILNLSYSEGLARTPNFSGSPNLERLIFKGCVHLVEICESIECLGKLVLLNLKDCKSLRKLPTNIHLLISLEKLIISGCSRLVEFPMNMTSMESLQVLHADGIAINAIFTTTRQVNSWHAFFPSWVSKPRISPNTFVASLPRTMLELSLTCCSLSEDSFPSTFSNLSLLKTLDLSYNLFGTLPDCVKSLGNLKFLRICSCRMLHSVLGLPSSLEFLQMGFSDSVKTVTFQSTQSQIAEAWTAECKNLDEIEGVFKIEPIGKVDKTLINNMGIDIGAMENIELQFRGLQNSRTRPIQGLHEFGIFSTFIPGGAVPSCFTDKNKGSSISFTVSSLSNLTIRCLNVCSLYYRDPNGELDHPLLTKINNKTKDLTWIYSPLCWGCPNEDEDLAWLSQWNFGNQLQSGDEVTVSIFMGDLFKVKECSINIVYEEQEENENEHDSTYFSWNEVVGGDLSSFRLSTGAYFLCRHSFDYPRDQWETDLLRETFREIADLEEIERLNMRCAVKTYW